jgi:hypothetical protein
MDAEKGHVSAWGRYSWLSLGLLSVVIRFCNLVLHKTNVSFVNENITVNNICGFVHDELSEERY